VVTALFDRAKAAGVLRADVEPSDAPLITMMVGSIIDRTRDVDPDLWRRYLGIVLDGLRPARDGTSPLTPAALGDGAISEVMRSRIRR
jgi:hypothetical protein